MTKRMRVFAGPNGSGKSSIIKNVLKTKVGKGKTLDFGIYINADDLAVLLLRSKVDFSGFRVDATLADLRDIALKSGLINKDFPIERFDECILFDDNSLTVNHVAAGRLKDTPHERIAQILADYLRKKLLEKEGFNVTVSLQGLGE
ncbi:MAG TPA: hypothetical protein PKG48_15980, partial [Bacteroidales bacterium]|nr:hypothetical protein [Bacteroidales bacterium]